jgi:hypothetical protein
MSDGMRQRWLVALAFLIAVAVGGCRRHTTTAADCRAILDRLVELELREFGYEDSVLSARWKRELEQRFSLDLARCRKLRVRDNLPTCLAQSQTPEEIAHRCLQ